jgi:ABC-type dipeptide/oligopeptide/nickel transport system permease component
MLGHALRRLLWTIPALFGISIITFLFLSYVPDPTDDPAIAARTPPAELERMRRERFLDLPRFVNVDPHDVRDRAEEIVAAIERGGPDAEEARRELARLGGAALPFVLPRFDSIAPDRRADLALALAPIARRMGLESGGDIDDRSRAIGFWTRFWDDRGIEFRRSSVRSAVSRLVRYGSTSRAGDLIELDTFVLDDVIGALDPPYDEAALKRARALIDVAAHVTGRDDRIAPGDDLAAGRACVDRWRSFWTVYRRDYTADAGVRRVADTVLETRYGKWAYEAVTHRFGRGPARAADVERPAVLDDLVARVPVTLGVVLGAISLAYVIAIPAGAIAALYRGRRVNVGVMLAVLALYVTPTAAIAVLARRAGGGGAALAIVVLALALVAAPTAQQSASLSLAISSDYVRAAVARGAGRTRAVLIHGLRNALLPVATLATLEGPMALGGAFVVERVFSLHGVGEATILAVQQRDTGWLMAISMVAALIAAILVVLADLVCIVIDPRLLPAILARRGRA